eukprot:Rhum_TRINITY_DN25560_c0_g1::Rhum_TRINITY_DN25560_c0_g1_i1::g.182318::m.182318
MEISAVLYGEAVPVIVDPFAASAVDAMKEQVSAAFPALARGAFDFLTADGTVLDDGDVRALSAGDELEVAVSQQVQAWMELRDANVSLDQTGFFDGVVLGDTRLVGLYLRSCVVNPDATDDYGDTALHIACRAGAHSAHVVALLVSEGVPMDVRNCGGETAMNIASRLHAADAVQALRAAEQRA